MFVFILSNFIITLGVFLYSNEREKGEGCGFGWVERIWEVLGEGNHDQSIFYGKIVFIKIKLEYHIYVYIYI